MKLDQKQRSKLMFACEQLAQKFKRVKRERDGISYEWGETCEKRPAGYVEEDKTLKKLYDGWMEVLNPELENLDHLLIDLVRNDPCRNTAKSVKLTPGCVWLWGGPTPYWGGSLQKDILVRGANALGIKNAVYVYGPNTPEMFQLHSGFEKMVCNIHLDEHKEQPGTHKYPGMELKDAENISRLSKNFPNIIGAMCDDVGYGYDFCVLPERFKARYEALKKHNDKLKMYATVYDYELQKDFSLVLPYIDTVTLWFWKRESILNVEEKVDECRRVLPGKPIVIGMFMHCYAMGDAGYSPELIRFQLDRCRRLLTRKLINGVVILGAREIKKWPSLASVIKDYLLNQ